MLRRDREETDLSFAVAGGSLSLDAVALVHVGRNALMHGGVLRREVVVAAVV